AAPGASRHDGPAHGVPDVHEADGPRSIRPDAFNQRPLWAERREVMPDATALLHRQRCFLDVLEDGAQVILDPAHDAAVEQGNLSTAPGACDDAPGRQKLET